MQNGLWRTRLTLIAMGVCVGLVARLTLGPPQPEGPKQPAFKHALPDHVPLSIPVELDDKKTNSNDAANPNANPNGAPEF